MDKSALSTWRGFVPSLDIKIAGEEPAVPQILKIDAIWVVAVQVATETLESSTEKAGFCKMLIVNAIDETMATSIAWHKKSVRLENVLQRQAYRLAGAMVSGKTYRGIRFRW